MADNDTPVCSYCGSPLDSVGRPYRVDLYSGSVFARHDDCQKITEAWETFNDAHRGLCHVVDCDQGTPYPWTHRE